jgi:hypothetical protein
VSVDGEGVSFRLRKGDRVKVVGYFQKRSYEKDGETKIVRQFVVVSIEPVKLKVREEVELRRLPLRVGQASRRHVDPGLPPSCLLDAAWDKRGGVDLLRVDASHGLGRRAGGRDRRLPGL